VSNVGKRSGVDKDGSSLQGLHEGRLDGVLHQDSHGTGTTNIVGSDGVSTPAGTNDHLSESVRIDGVV